MDNSERNKRRMVALVAILVVIAAAVSLALALVPLIPDLHFSGLELQR